MRNGELNRTSTEMTTWNTSAMCDLANKSGREAYVLKTLTVLALVFVPAGFVAVCLLYQLSELQLICKKDFLQMGYVSLKEGNIRHWSATADLKIYGMLSIPLISLTMLIYATVEMVQRPKERKLKAKSQSIV